MPFFVKILVRNHMRQLPLKASQAKPLRDLTAERGRWYINKLGHMLKNR